MTAQRVPASVPAPAIAGRRPEPVAGARRLGVAIATSDAGLETTLRRAAPDLHVVTTPAPVTLADLLMHDQVAVVVLDCALLGDIAPALIDRLAAQFPDVSLIAVGEREDELRLSAQLSAGRVFRFLHCPASVDRARTFLDGAVHRHAGHRDASRLASARRGSGILAHATLALIAAALLLGAATLWVLWPRPQARATATPAGRVERPLAGAAPAAAALRKPRRGATPDLEITVYAEPAARTAPLAPAPAR